MFESCCAYGAGARVVAGGVYRSLDVGWVTVAGSDGGVRVELSRMVPDVTGMSVVERRLARRELVEFGPRRASASGGAGYVSRGRRRRSAPERRLLHSLSELFQIELLWQFNAKYEPRWSAHGG